MYGTDVSHHQGVIDWNRVKNDPKKIEFALIKATESTSFIDNKYNRNTSEARKNEILPGPYHFARGGDYKKEAEHFLKNIDIKEIGELAALDYEIYTLSDPAAWCRKWLDYVEARIGFKPLFYTYHKLLLKYNWKPVSDGNFGLWASRFGKQEQTPNAQYKPTTGSWPFYAIWQFASEGKIDGIKGFVDLNYTSMELPTLKKYGKPGSTTPTTPIKHPSEIMNLKNWKLTLPTGKPTEITNLDGYSDQFFSVMGEGVVFRAPVNGATTSGSKYPRCELREMRDGNKASWSTQNRRSMTIEQAITHVPDKKKHIVAGQVHDANDDVIVIRLESPKLFIDINGKDGPVLDSKYELGRRFSVKFESGEGKIKVYYNSALAHTLEKQISGCYFKAGCYTQSNCEKEDKCSADNYGEVVIYKLVLDETPAAPDNHFPIIYNQLDFKGVKFGSKKTTGKQNNIDGYGCKLCAVSTIKQIDPREIDKILVNGGAYFGTNGNLLDDTSIARILGWEYLGVERNVNKTPESIGITTPTIKEVDYSVAAGKQQHFVTRILKPDGRKAILDPYGGVERPVNYYELKVGDKDWSKHKYFSYRMFKVK
ncbi:MAG: polysaccharide lyase family 7 protein [Patescibacteria group bacterium]|nr:polysaccharide lyase family 7 protein [Patescibacteria group bacterium]